VKKVNRKIVFGTILGLLTIIVIAAALFLPSLAQLDQGAVSTAQAFSEAAQNVALGDQTSPSVAVSSQPADPAGTLVRTLYLYGGNVYLHLPPGGGALANRPTDLYILVAHVYDATPSLAPLGGDSLQVSVWCPTTNSYVQVAFLAATTDPNFSDFAKAVYAGTPTSQNIFHFTAGDQFEVDMSGDVITVTLTTPITITIGDPFPQYLKDLSFTLPPFTLEFRMIGSPYQTSSTAVLPSGYTIQIPKGWFEPAFTRVMIPQWLGNASRAFDGTIASDETVAYYSP
jgi:hypothetical protein